MFKKTYELLFIIRGNKIRTNRKRKLRYFNLKKINRASTIAA